MGDTYADIAALHRAGASLKVETSDLCFLAAIEAKLRASGLTHIDEAQLRDLFESVVAITEPDAENVQKRATHAIQRFRDQRLLIRVDGHGLTAAGDYTTSKLATAIVEFFTEDQVLTRRSLTVLTATLAGILGDVLRAARAASAPDEWQHGVIDKLRITVSDLVNGILARQRGMDLQQEAVRAEIAQDLEAQWGDSLARCERLLDETSSTLRELSHMLIEDTAKLTGVLTEIEQVALAAERDDALVALRKVSQELERVGGWGQERLEGWSEYFQYVHRYLRGIVRLDPDRGVTVRLRDGLKGWSNAPWFLVVADPLPYLHLREPESFESSVPVTQPLADREPQPAEENASEPSIEASALAQAALGEGSVRLVELLRRTLPRAGDRERFAIAGRIAHALGSQGVVRYPRDEAWYAVLGDMEAQDWEVTPRNGT